MYFRRNYQSQHLEELLRLLMSGDQATRTSLNLPKDEIKKLYAGYSRSFYRNGFERLTLLGEETYAEAFKELLEETIPHVRLPSYAQRFLPLSKKRHTR